MKDRRSGILLHISSLPSKYAIGEMGKHAYKFVDFLQESSQSLWQILPTGPTGYGNSPYQSSSSFAGNTYLISIENLIENGLLQESECSVLESEYEFVDFEKVENIKEQLLKKACKRFFERGGSEFDEFLNFSNRESYWLEDFSLFSILKEKFLKIPFTLWDQEVKLREANIIQKYQNEFNEEIQTIKLMQFFFFKDYFKLKKYANDRGISIIGDLPIFVSQDSSDVWANQNLFMLDENAKPTFVSGVPPDYFSKTGQLWGNPLYNWKEMESDSFSWWINRMKHAKKLYDIVRIDHFRGFCQYWKVKASEETAEHGIWEDAPGRALFKKLTEEFDGNLNIIAEDLGVITKDVEQLRDDFGFPGMKILHFAFKYEGEDRDNPFLPHNYIKNCIAYCGTHDNDTTLGFMQNAQKQEHDFALEYLGKATNEDEVDPFFRVLFASSANTVILTMQDLLKLPSKYRMNTPSTVGDNWKFKCKEKDFTKEIMHKLKRLSLIYSRNKN